VIDPYRDACRVATELGGGAIELASPLLLAGFDDAPAEVRDAVAHGVRVCGLAYAGRRPIGDGVPWLQLLRKGTEPAAAAAAVISPWPVGAGPHASWPAGDVGAGSHPARAFDGQLAGLSATTADLPEAVPFALQAGYDLLVLEGAAPIDGVWPELVGAPDLSVMRDAIRILRDLNREEDIELLYFGGVRSGTDTAKLIGLGANAVIVSMSLALAVGGRIENGAVHFYGDIAAEDRAEKAELFLNALRAEASIMPRCTGKTDIRNLEPEDLRAISLATANAAGIPLAGFNAKLGLPL
jgi:glutamate synthase (NADPH) small chain